MAYKMKGFRGFGNSPLHQEERQAPAHPADNTYVEKQTPSEKPSKQALQDVLQRHVAPLLGPLATPLTIAKAVKDYFTPKVGRGGNPYRKRPPQEPQKTAKPQSKSE